MKTKYKFIQFVQINSEKINEVWSCRNNKSGYELGCIMWNGSWQQYCYIPSNKEGVLVDYSSDCLEDIADFIKQLKK